MTSEKRPTIDGNLKLPTTLGTFGVLFCVTASGVAAWTWSQAEIRRHDQMLHHHTQRLDAVEKKANDDHDILLEIRGDVKALRERSFK